MGWMEPTFGSITSLDSWHRRSPLLAAVGARTRKIEIGTAVIDMRYENPHYMAEDAGAADFIAGSRLQLGTSRGSPRASDAGDARNRHAANPGKELHMSSTETQKKSGPDAPALGVTRMQASIPQAPAVRYILPHSIEAFHEACHAVMAVLVDLRVNFVDLKLRTFASPGVPVGYVSTGFTSYDKAVTNYELIKRALSGIAPASWLTISSTQMMEPSATSGSCSRFTVFSGRNGV